MRDQIIIKYYRTVQYGQEREFVHPDSEGSGKIISQLTGQKSINGIIRELIRDLTAGFVSFQEVIAP